MKYKFLEDTSFSTNGYTIIEAKKGEEHTLSEEMAKSFLKREIVSLVKEVKDSKKTPVEKREKKVVEPTVLK